MTNKQVLWQQYYAAIRRNNKAEAQRILSQIHTQPQSNRNRGGGCSRCRKRFS